MNLAVCIAAAGLLAVGHREAEASEFEAWGRVRLFHQPGASRLVYDGKPNEAREEMLVKGRPVQDKVFEVAVQGGNWWVSTSNAGTMTFARLTACEAGYGIIHGTLLDRGRTNFTEIPFADVAVEPEGYPGRSKERMNQILWFAFASGTYTNPVAPDLPAPLHDLHAGENEKGQRAKWTRDEGASGLPRWAAYYVPDQFLAARKERGQVGPDSDAGFARYTYEVLASTTVNGQFFPMQAVFTEWTQHNSAKLPLGARPLFVTHIVVEKVVEKCSRMNWKPELGKRNSVTDFRLAQPSADGPRPSSGAKGTNSVSVSAVNGVTADGRVFYSVHETNWPSPAQVAAKVRRAQQRDWARKNSRPLLAWCLAAAVLVPPAILIGRWLVGRACGRNQPAQGK